VDPGPDKIPTIDSIMASGKNIVEQGTPVAERGAWGGKLEFILTCIGFSVGLGNVWRFPYLTFQNGGGAFLIPYMIFLVLLGLPMYCMELCFGQFASLGPTAIWKISPIFKGVGFAALCVSWYILIYFNVIISWALFYFGSSFSDPLPWTSCNNTWNTPNCTTPSYTTDDYPGNTTTIATTESMITTLGYDATTSSGSLNITVPPSPAEEFFYRRVLNMSDGLEDMSSISWPLTGLLFLSWLIVFAVLVKGVSSLGKVSYVTSTFPYVLLTVILVKGCMLEGAIDGILFYITPQWDKLLDLKVWAAAATQIFYSTGVCMGNLVAMSSFNKFNNNVLRDGMMIPFVNSATSVYAGFVIFSVLGYMAHKKGPGVTVENVVAEGPGLVFIVYPEGLATMPLPQLWSALFFVMMTLIGYSSQFSYGETLTSAIQDEFPSLREPKKSIMFRAAFCFVGFLCGLPMVTNAGFYIFNILNDYSGGYPLLFIGFLELMAIQYVYGFSRFSDDIHMMVGRRPNIFLKICWRYITPVIIAVITIFLIYYESSEITITIQSNQEYTYPQWGFAMAWLIATFPLSLILIFAAFAFCKYGGFDALTTSSSERPSWGPAVKENRTGCYNKKDAKNNTIFYGDAHGPVRMGHSSISVISSSPSVVEEARRQSVISQNSVVSQGICAESYDNNAFSKERPPAMNGEVRL